MNARSATRRIGPTARRKAVDVELQLMADEYGIGLDERLRIEAAIAAAHAGGSAATAAAGGRPPALSQGGRRRPPA